MKRRKQKLRPGDIVAIQLDDGIYSFGRVLKNPEMAFYGLRASDLSAPEKAIETQIIFTCWVMNFGVTGGHWPIVGHVPLSGDLLTERYYLLRDQLNGKFSITLQGEAGRPATSKEDMSLEPAMVWDPNHIEDRLRSHFKGEPCVWLQSFWRPIPSGASYN